MSEWRAGPTAEELRAAGRVPPEAVRDYMAGSGWRTEASARGGALWALADADEHFEVLLPEDRHLRDFPLRMFDLLRTLATVEGRSIGSIISELGELYSDVMTFRLLPDGPPGTVPLFNGVDALEGIRELVLASAYAATAPRPLVVQGRRPQQVHDFARRVRLGTPQAGSWVVSAQIGLPHLPAGQAADGEAPFARQVSLQIHRAVGGALAAADESRREATPIEPFLRRAGEGVSANLCEALAKLGRDGSTFEVRFGWARHLPVPTGGRRLFRFDDLSIRAIRHAAEVLRGALPDGPLEVTGTVERLTRGGAEIGSAVVAGVVRTSFGEAEQRVTVQLPSHLYDVVVEAHRVRRRIRVIGRARRGRVEFIERVTVLDD